jgi:hypothetical protein
MEIRYRRIKERDIDFFLLQQMCSCRAFLGWFFQKVTGQSDCNLTIMKAQHPGRKTFGQTDIELVVSDGDGRTWALLIEDKIAKTKQPFQAQRYKKRCCLYPDDECRIVLVAPRILLNGGFAKGYEPAIALEDILDWLQRNEPDGEAKQCKTDFIQQALTPPKGPDEGADFWEKYWNLTQQTPFSILNMRKTKHKRNWSASFRPVKLPRGVRIVHRLVDGKAADSGMVRLVFRRKRDSRMALNEAFKTLPHNGYEVVPHGETAVAICATVPLLIKERPFQPQKEKAAKALSEAVSLWAWFCEHQNVIMGAVSH